MFRVSYEATDTSHVLPIIFSETSRHKEDLIVTIGRSTCLLVRDLFESHRP
jgi:hypothetical protein